MKNTKKDYEVYQNLMSNKFDLEDRMAKIFNERWKLNNENTQCARQLRLTEDELRLFFKRKRIELKEDENRQ